MKLQNRTAIVSGGASGLGAATALALVQGGARVAVVDRNHEVGEELAAAHEHVHFFKADVTDAGELETALSRIDRELGAPSFAVGCAGVGDAARAVGRDGPLRLEAFERIVKINLIGMFNLVRLVAARMIPAEPDPETGERGVIVTTASIAAFDGQVGQSAYSASKAGVAAMTLPLAREFAKFGVRVVSIAPGLFDTPMVAGVREDLRRGMEASVPFPSRLGRPEEYAELVLHVLGNSMLNGEVIRLDGALRLAPR